MYPGSSPQSTTLNPPNSSILSEELPESAESGFISLAGHFTPQRRPEWPLPQYDPTVTAAVIDRIQASHSEAVGAVSSTRTTSGMASQGAPGSTSAGRPFTGRSSGPDFVAFSTSDLAAINRLGNSIPTSGSGLASVRPSGPQPASRSAAREQEERFLDFQALLQDEQQQNTAQNGTLRDHSESWRRVTAPPPNVNPFSDRARPSVIQMSPSALPSGHLPLFHQRAPGGPDSRSDNSGRFHTDQMSAVNQQRSRMAAEEYIRSRERAPDAQLFYTPFQRRIQQGPPHRPYLVNEPGQLTRVPNMQLPVPSPFRQSAWRSAASEAPPTDNNEHRAQQEIQRIPSQHSPFVTVLHTNPGQPLPVQGPIRNSRTRQPPARQPTILPLPTPSNESGPSSESGPGPSPAFWNAQNSPHFRDARREPAHRAHHSDPFSVSLNREGDAFVISGPTGSSSRAHTARNAALPYARPLIITPDYMLRRATGSPAGPAERSSLASEGSSSGMTPLDRVARMRDMQLRIDAAAARDRLMETVNINGERMPVDQVFPTRVSRLAHHEHLRALHDNNAEQRRRLVYIPQGHHPAGVAHAAMAFGNGRFASSLMQFMDAGIFMSNEHGEPKLILEEDVISAIACDTTSFKFDSQFPSTDECIICFEEFELQQEVRVLSCNHTHRFHKHCIDKWLIKNKPNCPICRQILPSLDPKKDITMPIIEAGAGPSTGGGPFSSGDWTAIFDNDLQNPSHS